MRAKRGLLKSDGTKTNEYEFIEKALRAMGGHERANMFTDLVKENKGMIDDWRTLFGSNKKVTYTQAVVRIANELDIRHPDGMSEEKIPIDDFNDIKQKAEQVTKDRANGLNKYKDSDPGHVYAHQIFSTITKKLGGKPHESQLPEQNGNSGTIPIGWETLIQHSTLIQEMMGMEVPEWVVKEEEGKFGMDLKEEL